MADLDSVRTAIAELCAKYGVVELSVFGSAARGDEDADSDIDLLYVRGPHAARGLAFFGLRRELESLLHRSVDLVPKEGLHWAIKDRVMGDARVLYAA
jgi:predicted nucleotidyltransferase